MRMVRQIVIAAVLAGSLWSRPAAAQSPPTPEAPAWQLKAELGATVNNAGLQNTIEVGRRQPLPHSPHPISADAHVAAGLTHVLTPAHTSVGGWLEYSPSAILQLRAGVQRSSYFGTFDSLMGFERPTDPFDKDARRLRGGARRGASTRLDLTPVFRLPIGPIVLYAGHGGEFWKSDADRAYFYEPSRDVLLTTKGDLLITFSRGVVYWRTLPSAGLFSVGVFHSGVYSAGSENETSRVGFAAVRESGRTRFRVPHPRISFVVARYLNDRSKRGQLSAAIALGLRTGS